jgi:hypothetical protein
VTSTTSKLVLERLKGRVESEEGDGQPTFKCTPGAASLLAIKRHNDKSDELSGCRH